LFGLFVSIMFPLMFSPILFPVLMPTVIPSFVAPFHFIERQTNLSILPVSILWTLAFIPLFAFVSEFSMVITKSAFHKQSKIAATSGNRGSNIIKELR
jgi:hypothetical protein